MTYIGKSNTRLEAVCIFNADTKTVEYHDFSKYYGKSDKQER